MAKRLSCMLMTCIVGVGTAYAQNINISGTVSDTFGPIPGATIIVVGTNIGTVTDAEGTYSLQVDPNAILEFRFIGMETVQENVNGRSVINVEMKNSSIAVDEVVVVGYGTQSKRTVTASISSVGSDAMKDLANVSAESALQGRAAGISITTPTGGVGEAPILRVRGVSSITSGTQPLYVVDGVPIQTGNMAQTGSINALADINPADILSMDVLKDAAAASMYGSRAANGVVLITTKKGKSDKVQVNFNSYVGFSSPTKKIKTMNAEEYVTYKNLSVANIYGTDEMSLGYDASQYGNKAFNLMPLSSGGYVDTNWNDEVYRTGFQQNYTVSINGGSERVQYYFSANYNHQNGITKGDSYERYGGTANVTAKATDWLKLGMNFNASSSTTESYDKSKNGGVFSNSYARYALILPPNIPAWNEDGSPYLGVNGVLGYGPNTTYCNYSSPAALLQYANANKHESVRIINSYFAELRPIEGLMIRTQLGLDIMRLTTKQFNSPIYPEVSGNGSAYNYQLKNHAITWTNLAQYSFSLGRNNFDAMIGIESYLKNRDIWGAYKTDLLDSKFQTYQADWANIYPTSNDNISESSLLSYMARLNYDYDSRYMLSLNFRRDGYSALSKNNRWGNFGGVSAAWRVSSEKFFTPLTKIFQDMKIKGSWGIVGNTNISDYAAKTYYASGYYGESAVYNMSNLADAQNLKWESSTKVDVGINAQFLDRFTFEFDYYWTKASDLILDIPVSPSKGIPGSSITSNAGKMINSGIEGTISVDLFRTKDFSWSTSFNITTTHNEVKKLADGVSSIVGGSGSNESNITLPGYSIAQLYTTPTAGVDPETGRRVFIAKDGTRVLFMFEKTGKYFNAETGEAYPESNIEKVISGGTIPTFYGGWTNDFKYKGFDLSLLFQFSGGNYIYNGTTATMSDGRWWNNSKDVWNNYWTEERRNAKYPKPIWQDNYSNGSGFPISEWVEKGDYFRLKTLSFGYTFNTKGWDKLQISNLRLYMMAQNLFTLTHYSGYDPEATIMTNNATLQAGVDKNTLPQARVFTFGVNINF